MALIFNIQRFSLHDGPGIRTTAFLKGCPLKCLWCHNPESQNFNKEMMVFSDKCISCGYCLNACKPGGITNIEKCILCEECSNECPTNARSIAGKEMTIDEVIFEIEKDRSFYDQSGGGVTISGGEPLSHIEFLFSLLKELKSSGFHITIDTSGYAPKSDIEKILPYTDLFLYDLKCIDREKHKKYTGVYNEIILQNLVYLNNIGKNLIVRIPIIPTINDKETDIKEFIDFLITNKINHEINLLPYHNISSEKYKRLGINYTLNDIQEPSISDLERIKDIFQNKGLKVKIGG